MSLRQGKNKGVACPECQCRDSHVITVKNLSMTIMRNRECNECGSRWRTREVNILEPVESTGVQKHPRFGRQKQP
jgi:transcriptional regulator NrdR family protein